MHRFTFILFGILTISRTFAQSGVEIPFTETDTISLYSVVFTTSSASEYIINLLEKDNLWRPSGDTIKHSLTRLIDHFNEPFDSTERRLLRFNYDSIKLERIVIVRNDTLSLRWLNDSTFIIDTVSLDKEPFIIQKTVIYKAIYTSAAELENANGSLLILWDFLPEKKDSILMNQDSLILKQDTITKVSIDSVFLDSMDIQIHHIVNGSISPSPVFPDTQKSAMLNNDSTKIIISDRTKEIVGDRWSPFYIVPNEKTLDSLQHAVETLLSHTFKRDSIPLFINDRQGQKTPFWLGGGKNDLYRYWVKNYKNDSITIWIGNPTKYDLTLILEEDLNVIRMEKEEADDIPITLGKPERSLAKIEPFEEIPVFWDYNFSSSFALNQTYFSNWSKGGGNSLSSLLDLNGTARYTNTEAKTQWTNALRINYGAIVTEENRFRTNNDRVEFDSKYNKIIKEKIDLSAVFYTKNQMAKGYNYPNDSVVVSKFLNPGTFTVGLGVEYKPFKNTSFNFSLLSYKNTFVLDTANIDQTLHGIANDKRIRQEMGGQLLIKNKISILSDLEISNSIRLFSGYLNKPQNIDVDWEINFKQKINWYFTIILNLHMIYDDDIRFPALDENDQPILHPDGSTKKIPLMQFKQFLGLSFLFSF